MAALKKWLLIFGAVAGVFILERFILAGEIELNHVMEVPGSVSCQLKAGERYGVEIDTDAAQALLYTLQAPDGSQLKRVNELNEHSGTRAFAFEPTVTGSHTLEIKLNAEAKLIPVSKRVQVLLRRGDYRVTARLIDTFRW